MTQTLSPTDEHGNDRLYSLEEAMRLLGGISRTSLYGLMKDGELRTLHIGNRRFVPQSEISSYIRRGLSA